MTSRRFIRWSGWALALGGLAIAVGFLISEEAVFYGLFLLAPIFLGFGMLGLRARYGDEMGSLGKGVLWAGVLGAAIALVGAIGQMLDNDDFFLGTFAGLTLIFTSLLVFGAMALRRKLLPRGNVLPVLAGFWLPLIAVLWILSEILDLNWTSLPDTILAGVFIFIGIALLLLGYVVQADAVRKTATTQAG